MRGYFFVRNGPCEPLKAVRKNTPKNVPFFGDPVYRFAVNLMSTDKTQIKLLTHQKVSTHTTIKLRRMDRYSARTDFRRSCLPLCGKPDEYGQNLNNATHPSIGILSYHDHTTPNGLLVNTRFTSLLFFIILLDYEQFFKRSYEFPYDYTFIYNIFSFYIMDHSFLLPQNEKIGKAYNFLIKNLIPVRKVDSI